MSYDMGGHVTRHGERRKLNLDQLISLTTIMSRFGIDKTTLVPANAGGSPLSKEDEPNPPEKEQMPDVPYRESLEAII